MSSGEYEFRSKGTIEDLDKYVKPLDQYAEQYLNILKED